MLLLSYLVALNLPGRYASNYYAVGKILSQQQRYLQSMGQSCFRLLMKLDGRSRLKQQLVGEYQLLRQYQNVSQESNIFDSWDLEWDE